MIYFESGEADGPEPTYTDRIYISTDFRDSGHRTTGPGSSCEGQCGGNAGGADATLYEYHAVPAPEDQYWVIWLR